MKRTCRSRTVCFAAGNQRLGAAARFLLLAIAMLGFLNAKASAVQVTVDASSSAAVGYFADTPRESFVRFFGNDRSLFPLGQNEFDLTLGVPATVDINYLQEATGTHDGSFASETHTVSYTATVGNQSAEIVYDITTKLVFSQFQFDYHLLSPETVRFGLAPGQFLDFSPLPKGSGPLGQVNENNGGSNAAAFRAQLTLGVPEPSVGVLLGLGGAFAFASLRRRQRV